MGITELHALNNPIIERPINLVGKMLRSSYLFEAVLTRDRGYNGFPLNLKKLYAQNIISQMIMLVNRIKEIVYRGTEKKTLTCNAIIKFKLGNPARSLHSKNTVSEGKIGTKVSLPS